jgi:hypothetical protein
MGCATIGAGIGAPLPTITGETQGGLVGAYIGDKLENAIENFFGIHMSSADSTAGTEWASANPIDGVGQLDNTNYDGTSIVIDPSSGKSAGAVDHGLTYALGLYSDWAGYGSRYGES